jgi:hypothetical protein
MSPKPAHLDNAEPASIGSAEPDDPLRIFTG